MEEVVGEEEDREMKQKGSRWLHTVLALLAHYYPGNENLKIYKLFIMNVCTPVQCTIYN